MDGEKRHKGQIFYMGEKLGTFKDDSYLKYIHVDIDRNIYKDYQKHEITFKQIYTDLLELENIYKAWKWRKLKGYKTIAVIGERAFLPSNYVHACKSDTYLLYKSKSDDRKSIAKDYPGEKIKYFDIKEDFNLIIL
jgi:protein associated with RNAse G/E